MFRFFGRDVEKQRIEFVDAGDEAAPLAVMAPALTAILAKVLPPVPSLPGNFNDAVLALAQIAPIGFDVDRLGIATAQSDNGDRIGVRCRGARGAPQTVESPVRNRLRLDGRQRGRDGRRRLTLAIRSRGKERR